MPTNQTPEAKLEATIKKLFRIDFTNGASKDIAAEKMYVYRDSGSIREYRFYVGEQVVATYAAHYIIGAAEVDSIATSTPGVKSIQELEAQDERA